MRAERAVDLVYAQWIAGAGARPAPSMAWWGTAACFLLGPLGGWLVMRRSRATAVTEPSALS